MTLDRRLLAPVRPELVWFTGPDAIRFLNDLISQEIGTAAVGEVRRTLLLTPQGKIDFVLWALRGDDRVGLLTEDGRGEELISRLSRYRIRVDVEIEMESQPVALVLGGIEAPDRGWISTGDGLRADVSWPDLPRMLVVGAVPDLPVMSTDDYTVARIEAGEPLVGVDVDDGTIPQETGLVPETISFDKGCFLGQELAARLDSRGGRVNHHLRVLRFDGEAAAVGSEVVKDGETVGTLSSASGKLGMARLRRGVEAGDMVTAGGEPALVITSAVV
ncbi:MAG: YgfZ/GcvT domain-containing protein [Acidimicrobiia bacterium]